MNRRNDPLLLEPTPRSHLVQMYEQDPDLAEAVATYVAQALDRGEAAVLVLTPAHWQAVAPILAGRGHDPDRLDAEGQLVVLDAADTLDRVSHKGQPDMVRFHATIGAVYERTRKRFCTVRAFGEMVDLLWQAGDPDAAMALEKCWLAFMEDHPLTLLCAYRTGLMDGPHSERLEEICNVHSHALLPEDRRRLDDAMDKALEDVVGPRRADSLRPLIHATLRPNGRLGGAEKTVFWMRRNLPDLVDPLLQSARGHYDHRLPARQQLGEAYGADAGARVLLVEDDPDDVFLVRHSLQAVAPTVRLAAVEDGETAEAYLRRRTPFDDPEDHPVPEVVLLDLKLPRRSGLEFLAWMRTQPELRDIPVFLLSSSSDPREVAEAYELGANGFLSKEGDLKALDRVLEGVLAYVDLHAERPRGTAAAGA